MARIDFPSNPSDGQTLTVTVAGSNTVYTYNATYGVWRSLSSSDAYLQVANLQPALDKYLQVSNGTSLTSFNVITNTPSGNGSLVYSSSNGSFTFTPANATQGGGGVTQDTLDQYLQVANSTSFATTSSLDAYLQVANSTGFASSTDLDAYLQVANSTGFASSTDLDAYLQVANSTSFATTSSLDAYLQVANSTSFASTSQLDAYLQVANSTSFASTSDLDAYLQVANANFITQSTLDTYLQVANSTSFATTSQLDAYLQVANSTSFATTSQLDAYLQVTNSISLTSFDVLTSTPSGNGSLVYNSSNGSFTFTPANATQGGGGGGVTQDTLDNYLQVANGVSLTAFDVLTTTPSGNGSLVYNSSNGSFTFTPADATQGGGGGGGGASVTASDTAPSSPSAGDLWFHTTQLKLYVYYSDGSSNQWIQTNSGVGNRVDEFIKAYRYQGTLAINTGDTRLYLQDSYILKGIHAYVDTAPTGSSVITDVKKNGSSLQTITVAAGATTASNTSLSHTFVSGDYLTVDITQVGSSTAGENLYMVFTFN